MPVVPAYAVHSLLLYFLLLLLCSACCCVIVRKKQATQWVMLSAKQEGRERKKVRDKAKEERPNTIVSGKRNAILRCVKCPLLFVSNKCERNGKASRREKGAAGGEEKFNN